MHDTTPRPKDPPPAPAKPASADKYSPANLIGAVVRHLLQQEIRAVHFVPDLLRVWTHLALPDIDTLRFSNALRPPPRAPKTRFNVDITSQRAYAARSLPLADVKWIAQQANVKINDVVLALCGSVLRRYLDGKGELPAPPLTAMVPVSLRDPKDKELNNQNSMIVCSLATDLAAAADRLDAVAESANQQKTLFKNVRDIMIPELAFIGSGILMRGLVNLSRRANLASRLPPLVNLPVSNVPGPTVPLYLAGARVLTFYPVSIPVHSAALNITVESYCSSLDIGLTACRRTVPDLADLADMFAPALEELKAGVAARAAEASDAPKAAKKTRRTAAAAASHATAKQVRPVLAKPEVGPAARAARSARRPKGPIAPKARGKSKTERPGRAGVANAATVQ
jgi:WS/DGAT/MGAT family acyltransferase